MAMNVDFLSDAIQRSCLYESKPSSISSQIICLILAAVLVAS